MTTPLSLETAEFDFLIGPLQSNEHLTEPRSNMIRVRFGAVSDKGHVRERNEDHYMVARIRRTLDVLAHNVNHPEMANFISEDAYSMVVADGMGGMNAGDMASMLAISTGMRLVDKSVKWGFKINKKEADELLARMRDYFREIDRRLTKKSEGERKLFGMGTTLTLAYSVGIHLFVIHVGDSRAYLYRDGTLTQVTKDHTIAQALADAGEISQEEVKTHRRRNTLTNYLGGHRGNVKADVHWLTLKNNDRILLCSDGLNDMVDDPAIAECLTANPSADKAALALTQLALDHGGKDNITVIVADYAIPGIDEQAPPGGDTKEYPHLSRSDLFVTDLLEDTEEFA